MAYRRFVLHKKGHAASQKETPDVALICCHGGEGENGVLQGFLEYNGVPYTSAGLIASSVCMDKSIAKQLLDGLMLNTMPSITVSRGDFEKNTNDVIRHVSTFLEYPLIVKPSGLGSSIGIKKARTEDELKAAIEVAAKFDEKSLSKTRWKISKNLIARRIPTDETYMFRKWKAPCPGTIFVFRRQVFRREKRRRKKGNPRKYSRRNPRQRERYHEKDIRRPRYVGRRARRFSFERRQKTFRQRSEHRARQHGFLSFRACGNIFSHYA